jgi:hypothetical protein
VQWLDKGFCWSLEAETFSWGIIVVCDDGVEAGFWQVCDVGFSGERASEPSDGVFDAAFLPRCVRIALTSPVLTARIEPPMPVADTMAEAI